MDLHIFADQTDPDSKHLSYPRGKFYIFFIGSIKYILFINLNGGHVRLHKDVMKFKNIFP